MQLHKLTCSYISLQTVTWACMQFPELACSSLSLHAVPWACMQFPELSFSSLNFHEVQSAYMKFHELTWSSMSLHAVPWACMQFHKLVKSSMKFYISLSEQFTRSSQCFFMLIGYNLISRLKKQVPKSNQAPINACYPQVASVSSSVLWYTLLGFFCFRVLCGSIYVTSTASKRFQMFEVSKGFCRLLMSIFYKWQSAK